MTGVAETEGEGAEAGSAGSSALLPLPRAAEEDARAQGRPPRGWGWRGCGCGRWWWCCLKCGEALGLLLRVSAAFELLLVEQEALMLLPMLLLVATGCLPVRGKQQGWTALWAPVRKVA